MTQQSSGGLQRFHWVLGGVSLNGDRHPEVISAQMQLGIGLSVPVAPTVMVSKGGGSATMLADRSFPSIQQAVDALLTTSGAR